MQRLLKIVFCIIALAALPHHVAIAQTGQYIYYAGSHECSGQTYYDDMVLRPAEDGLQAASIYTRQDGSTYNEQLVIAINFVGTAKISTYDQYGNSRLALTPNADQSVISAQWLDAGERPRAGCPAFKLYRTNSPKERYDDLIKQLTAEKPNAETARNVAKGLKALPPLELVPPREQQIVRNAYREASLLFWEHFYLSEIELITTMPIESTEQQQALISELRKATEPGLVPPDAISAAPFSNGNDFAYAALNIAADRMAEKGIILPPITYKKADDLCSLFTTFPQGDIKSWELVSGLPAEYWNRTIADNYIALANKCKTDNPAKGLASLWPEFEKRRKDADWLRNKAKEFADLPEALEAYRQASWLDISNALQEHNISENSYKRFLIGSIRDKKNALDRVAAQSFDDYFKTQDVIDDNSIKDGCDKLVGNNDGKPNHPSFDAVYALCLHRAEAQWVEKQKEKLDRTATAFFAGEQSVSSLAAHGWLEPEMILDKEHIAPAIADDFRAKTSAIREKLIPQAMNEITQALAEADPTKDESKLFNLCNSLPEKPSSALQPLVQSCVTNMNAYHKKRDQALCALSLKQAGIGESLSNATLYPDIDGRGQGIKLCNFICTTMKGYDVKIKGDGILWWMKRYLEISSPAANTTQIDHFRAELIEAGDGYTFKGIEASGLFEKMLTSDLLQFKHTPQ